MVIDPELAWLRPRVIRLRALLRYAQVARVETILLREFLADAETRLEALEEQALTEKPNQAAKQHLHQ
jgi:hypothetical protein